MTKTLTTPATTPASGKRFSFEPAGPAPTPPPARPRARRGAWIIEGLCLAGGLLMIAPLAVMLLTAFKSDSEIVRFQGLLPRVWTLANFTQILATPEEVPILRWFLNSVLISSATTLLVLTVDSLAAFALARLALPGRRAVFGGIVATLMVPGQILLVPVYLILNWLGWLDTPLALIVPAGASAFGVFLLHQFFVGIPRDLEEAARIDGCSLFGIYRYVVLPLSLPALATLAIFTFIGSWNDFLGPLVFLESMTQYTLPVGVAFFQTSYYAEYGLTLAASVLCTAPVLAIFLLLQRHIMRGIALSGLKD